MKTNRSHTPLLLAATLAFAILSARADVGIYEGFTYAAGTSIDGANNADDIGFGSRNWEDQGDPTQDGFDTVVAGSLSFGMLQTSGNRLVSTAPVSTGSTVQRRTDTYLASGDIVDGQTLWASWLVRLDAGNVNGDTNGLMYFTPSGNDELFVGIRHDDADKKFALYDTTNTMGESSLSSTSLTLGQTYFLVLSITFYESTDIDPSTSGKFEEEVSLFINPTPGLSAPDVAAAASLNTLDISRSNTSNLGQSRIFRIGFLSGGTGEEWSLDEIRIGDTYGDVSPVPEPSSLALLFLGFAATLRRRRSV